MRYQVLMLDVQTDIYHALKHRLDGVDVNFTIALTMQDAAHLCAEQSFHLIILNFSGLILCSEYMIAFRRTTYAPIIALLAKYNIENAHLISCVDHLLHTLCEQPDYAVPSPAVPKSGTVQTAQAEFDQELDKPEFDEVAATAKALALAATKFDALGSHDYETMRMRYILTHAKQHDGLDVDLLRQITAAILIHPSGAVGVKLKNKQYMEQSEE